MPTGIFREDGTTNTVIIGGGSNNDVHISFEGGFGGGTLAMEKLVASEVFPLRDGGTAITHTVADDSSYLLKSGDVIQFTLAGSTNPTLRWSVTGN